MKKSLIIVVIVIIICIVLSVIGVTLINRKQEVKTNTENNSKTTSEEEKILYATLYSFGFGSRSVKIYENGDVYDDLEIEDPNPNHIPNYKFVKTLTREQVNRLKEKIENNVDYSELDEFVIKEVYGVEKFDDFGNY